MPRIAEFKKVSMEQWEKDWDPELVYISETDDPRSVGNDPAVFYNALKLPRRATAGSAGYDICSPCDIMIRPGETVLIPTGIRVKMDPEWVFCIFPRSGLGFKYRLQLNNTVGIIDSDYYGAENEGHILCKVTNDSREGRSLFLEQGKGFAQGIFFQYGITEDDDADGTRTGGFGSTTV